MAEGRLRGGLPQQLAGGQGAENVVIHPFIADLSVDEKDGGPLLRVPADEDLPLSKVRAVPKNEADVIRRQVPLEPGFLAGVGGNVLPFGARSSPWNRLLSFWWMLVVWTTAARVIQPPGLTSCPPMVK